MIIDDLTLNKILGRIEDDIMEFSLGSIKNRPSRVWQNSLSKIELERIFSDYTFKGYSNHVFETCDCCGKVLTDEEMTYRFSLCSYCDEQLDLRMGSERGDSDGNNLIVLWTDEDDGMHHMKISSSQGQMDEAVLETMRDNPYGYHVLSLRRDLDIISNPIILVERNVPIIMDDWIDVDSLVDSM